MTILPTCILHPQIATETHICMICDIFNTKVNTFLALLNKQGLTGTALSMQIVPFAFEQSDHLQMQEVPGDDKLCPLIDYSQGSHHLCGMAVMKRSQHL